MKAVVVFWTGTGNTGMMADKIASALKENGAETDIFEVSSITASQTAAYDCIALGCPAMGAEVLEEGSFAPFYDELEPLLSGKKVALFGSYGWGDGEWMRSWEDSVKAAGANLVDDGLIVCGAPSDDDFDSCSALAKALVG